MHFNIQWKNLESNKMGKRAFHHTSYEQNGRRLKRKKENQPGDQERLIQTIEDIDNQVLISNRLNLWPWKLPINQDTLKKQSRTRSTIIKKWVQLQTLMQKYYLLLHSKRPYVTICDVPCKKPIWVFTIDAAQAHSQEQESERPQESNSSHSFLKEAQWEWIRNGTKIQEMGIGIHPSLWKAMGFVLSR